MSLQKKSESSIVTRYWVNMTLSSWLCFGNEGTSALAFREYRPNHGICGMSVIL
jgi:hypothetical protein